PAWSFSSALPTTLSRVLPRQRRSTSLPAFSTAASSAWARRCVGKTPIHRCGLAVRLVRGGRDLSVVACRTAHTCVADPQRAILHGTHGRFSSLRRVGSTDR